MIGWAEDNTPEANSRDRRPVLPPTPIGFKIWFAFCAVLGTGMLSFGIWAVLQLLRILDGP